MTIGGIHTQHELADLWSALSFEKAALWKAALAATSAWRQLDDTGYARFSVGQTQLDAKLADFMPRLSATLGAQGNPDVILATDLQGDVFVALQELFSDDASTGTPGLNSLDAMMRSGPATVAAMAPTYKGIPQPTAPDLDLAAYKLSDQAVKVIERIGSSGISVLTVVLIAGVVYLLVRRR